MQGKIMLVLGGAVGYVIGTRAGRQGYERLKRRVSSLWNSPQVQQSVSSAGSFARENIPVIGGTVDAAVKKIASGGSAGSDPDGAGPDTTGKHLATDVGCQAKATPSTDGTAPPASTPTVDVVIDGDATDSPTSTDPSRTDANDANEAKADSSSVDATAAGEETADIPGQGSNNG